MLYTRERAKELIAAIISDDDKVIKTGMTLPVRMGEKFKVYRIPLEYLVPNQDNDRITWKIREYEAENNRKLDIENEQDVEYLYELVYKESVAENQTTMEDLAKKGQQVDGVITNNGIIIDGNRRATLLRRLYNGEADKYNKSVEDFRYFNCIVLPNDMQRKEIMALETMLQIGVDEKVKYNRICLYIKVDNLIQAGYTHTQIKQYMNLDSEKVIDEMRDVYQLMVRYLQAIGKPNHYTLLDGLEDQFIQTNRVFKLLDNQTYNASWQYSTADIANFKSVCFDYMRAKFEGKKYRSTLLGRTKSTDGVFIEENTWKKFFQHHEEIIETTDPVSETDWHLLGKPNGQLDINLNRAADELASVIRDKDISKVIDEIRKKISKLCSLVENNQVSEADKTSIIKASSALAEIVTKL